jgi:hypothetical protein
MLIDIIVALCLGVTETRTKMGVCKHIAHVPSLITQRVFSLNGKFVIAWPFDARAQLASRSICREARATGCALLAWLGLSGLSARTVLPLCIILLSTFVDVLIECVTFQRAKQ